MSSSSHHQILLSGFYIPTHIIVQNFSYLDVQHKVKIAQVCHNWRNIVYDDVMWKDTKVKVFMEDIDEQYLDTIIPSLVRRNISEVKLHLANYDNWASNSIHNLNKLFQEMTTLKSIKIHQKDFEDDSRIDACIAQFPFHHARNLIRIDLRLHCFRQAIVDKLDFILQCKNLEIFILEKHSRSDQLESAACDNILLAITRHLKKLRYLEIPTYGLTDLGIGYITGCLSIPGSPNLQNLHPQLEILILRHCIGLTDESLQHVSSGLNHLKLLEINFSREITNRGVGYLGKMKCLQELILNGCYGVNDECVKLLSEAGSQIQHFAAESGSLGDKALQYFAQNQFPLKELKICYWQITDNGICQLVKSGKEIQSLTMWGLDSITDSALEIIAEKLPSLRHINIIDCKGVTRKALQKLGERSIGKLVVMSTRFAIQSTIKSKYLM